MTVHERFEKFMAKEFLEFERVENKLSKRPDLHAFLLLDRLVPGDNDIVVYAEHDEIWLAIDTEKLKTASDDEIRDLVRCGVRSDSSTDSLAMFV